MKKKDNHKSGELETIRKNIDSIDEKIQLLINDRARLAKEIGLTKNKKGSSTDFYKPERESDVILKEDFFPLDL